MVSFVDTAPKLVVFSDLDGTLLDHETYSWQPARPALERMKGLGIPLILASSKTAIEIADLRAQMGFSHCPAIVENGAGLLRAGADGGGVGRDYDRIRAALDGLQRNSERPSRVLVIWECNGLPR